LWERVRLRAYGRACRVIVQTGEAQRYFPKCLQKQISIIPNIVGRLAPFAAIKPSVQYVIGVGRLIFLKDHETLIRADTAEASFYLLNHLRGRPL
jgi:hypothetical protein